ncbi:MAG: hypothetical protein RLZZ450_6533 [Pseudomonadota bacterium]
MGLRPLSWLILLGLAAVGCGEERGKEQVDSGSDPVGVGPGSPPNAAPTTSDAALGTRPPQTLDAGIDAGATPPLVPSAAPDACVPGPLAPPPASSCATSDVAEPNSIAAPAALSLDPSCAALTATTGSPDPDAYRFVANKSDPVLVELSYAATDSTDLYIEIVDTTGTTTPYGDKAARSGPSEQISGAFKAVAGQAYDLRVRNRKIGMCQSYALRVDDKYCTDKFEDNDTEGTPTRLSLDASGKATVEGTIHQLDSDFFQIVTPKADPFLVKGTYTPPAGETLTIRRIVADPTGKSVVDVVDGRKGPTGSFAHWVDSDAPGSAYRLWLWPDGSGCSPYSVEFDTAACTDAYEDNETPDTAAKLPLGSDVSATVISSDSDYFEIGEVGAGGSCTVTYTVVSGTSSTLRVNVYGFDGAPVTNALGGEGNAATKTMKLTWGTKTPARLVVDQDIKNSCQPYTIRCDKAATPAQ